MKALQTAAKKIEAKEITLKRSAQNVEEDEVRAVNFEFWIVLSLSKSELAVLYRVHISEGTENFRAHIWNLYELERSTSPTENFTIQENLDVNVLGQFHVDSIKFSN